MIADRFTAHFAGSYGVTSWLQLSAQVPLLAKIYPNGRADVNHFHAAGGMGVLIGELLDAGLLHEDVLTVSGQGLARYREEPFLDELFEDHRVGKLRQNAQLLVAVER